MRKRDQIYEVEIKSQSLLREGKRGLITYFQGGTHEQIAANIRQLYPQYTQKEDLPMFNIRPISFKEYTERVTTGKISQKAQLLKAEA